jgi:hypothetical protein
VQWFNDGHISKDDQDEIVAIVQSATFSDWRPLIYVIPYSVVANRVLRVPRAKRASHEPEYIVEDLADGEFQIVEPSE